MRDKKGKKQVKSSSSISNPSDLASLTNVSAENTMNQSINENIRVSSSEANFNMSSSSQAGYNAMYQHNIHENDTLRQQCNPGNSHIGEVAQRQSHHSLLYPNMLERHANQNFLMSVQHPLCVSDGVNDNTKMHLYHQQQQYSVPPMPEKVNAPIPAPYAVDSATGLPLHMLDKLHELLPSASNSKLRNNNQTLTPSSLDVEKKGKEKNVWNQTMSNLESTPSVENIKGTISTPTPSPIPSLRHQNTIIDSTSFTTPSKSPNRHSLPNEYIQPNSQYAPPLHQTSSSKSTNSVINNLKTSNEQLEKSIASGNMHNANLETQYKMLESDCNAYNHSIRDLNAKLEAEKRLRISSQQRKNVKLDKYDRNRSGSFSDTHSRTELHAIDKNDKISSNVNDTKDTLEDDSILIEKIKSLENELNTSRMRAKTTFENMEKDLFEEINKLSEEQDGIKKHLLSENQYLSKTNKTLLDEVKEKTMELKKRGVEV